MIGPVLGRSANRWQHGVASGSQQRASALAVCLGYQQMVPIERGDDEDADAVLRQGADHRQNDAC